MPAIPRPLNVLEQTLFDVWRDRTLHPAVAFALGEFHAHPSLARLAELKSAVGLSEKRFIEHFKAQIGVTPKRFYRLRRFQHAVACAHRSRTVDWAGLALSCGYADQAHFIHEFREFSGITPCTYGERKTEFQNHVSFLQS